MKQIKTLAQSPLFYPVIFLVGLFCYYYHYFNYIAMPTEDYIGNFRPFVMSILAGDFSSISNKLMPAYPFLLAALSLLMPEASADPIYTAAIIFNFILLLPFLCITYLLYKRFLDNEFAFIAFVFLGTNIYTLYSGLNAELEIFLCTMIVLSIYLMSKKSWLAAIPTAITGIIKWDVIFMIPAYALHILNKTKKIKNFILCGIITSLPLIAWVGFTMLRKGHSANTYLGEIAHRGPNIYKYPIDALVTSFGFPRWLAMDIYHGRDMLSSIILAAIAVITLIALLMFIIYGIKTFIKIKDEPKLPLLIFSGGFIIVHLIYQNTKDRYVVPIIWLLIMFTIFGIKKLVTEGSFKVKNIFELNNRPMKQLSIFIILGIFYIQSVVILFEKSDIFLLVFAFFVQVLILTFLHQKTSLSLSKRLLAGLTTGIICFLNIAYTGDTLDHFSMRRIEFKEAAIWFKDNAPPNARMLMSETSVACYYTGMDGSRIIATGTLTSTDVSSLISELQSKNITHVFVDDFYISRLLLNDPNAIDRKAVLMKALRDAAPDNKSLRLLQTFKTYTGPEAYMYCIEPK